MERIIKWKKWLNEKYFGATTLFSVSVVSLSSSNLTYIRAEEEQARARGDERDPQMFSFHSGYLDNGSW